LQRIPAILVLAVGGPAQQFRPAERPRSGRAQADKTPWRSNLRLTPLGGLPILMVAGFSSNVKQGNIMIDHISQVVRRLIDGLGADVKVIRAYAYGSRVRGDADQGSDLDLLVELHEVTRAAKRQILDRAWELSQEEGYVISVAIVSQEAFEQGPLSASQFAQTIRREGIEIAA
jgi:predicted nucleotidyltransferase